MDHHNYVGDLNDYNQRHLVMHCCPVYTFLTDDGNVMCELSFGDMRVTSSSGECGTIRHKELKQEAAKRLLSELNRHPKKPVSHPDAPTPDRSGPCTVAVVSVMPEFYLDARDPATDQGVNTRINNLLGKTKDTIVIDIEYTSSRSGVDVMSLCLIRDPENVIVVHLTGRNRLPASIKCALGDGTRVKVGFAVETDNRRITEHFDLEIVNFSLDLRTLAAALGITDVGLDTLASRLKIETRKYQLDLGEKTKWNGQLSIAQLEYARNDVALTALCASALLSETWAGASSGV